MFARSTNPRLTQEEKGRIILWVREWILAGQIVRGMDAACLTDLRSGGLVITERFNARGRWAIVLHKSPSGWVFTGGKTSIGPAVRVFSNLDGALEAVNTWIRTYILRQR